MDAETRDRVALITGAGSPTGIGFATARVLGREGAAIAIASTTERIHERAAELAGMGFEAAGFTADLTDREQARTMVATVLEAFGRIDILVNNAGHGHGRHGRAVVVARSPSSTTRPGISTSR